MTGSGSVADVVHRSCSWRLAVSTLAVLACAGLGLAAQDRPTFRAGVELVSLSVTARDAEGRHVTGLTAGDFVVLEDGLPQDVVFFSPAEARLDIQTHTRPGYVASEGLRVAAR